MAETPWGRLTPSSITLLQETADTSGKPVVQVLDIALIRPQPNRSDRYRILLSDGATSCHAMLATQLTPLARAGIIAPHTVVRLNDFVLQDIRDAASGTSTRVVVVLTLDVLGPGGGVAGSPAPYTPATTKPAAPLDKIDVIGFVKPEPGARAASGSASGASASGGLMWMAARSPVRATAHRPISIINPYQRGWKIRGRCSSKFPLKTFTNKRGEGKVLSFELTDDSGSILITGFGDSAVKAEALVHVGSLYSLSGAVVKPANEKFNRSSSDFEITLDSKSVLEAIEDDGSVASIKFKFTKISELDKLPAGECDVVAVVHRVSDVDEIVARSTGEAVKRRVVTLVDDSGASVELTFFRDQCARYLIDDDAHPVVVLRGAKRSDFNSVSLGVTGSTTVLIDPTTVPEASILRSWYDAHAWTEESLRAMSGCFCVSGGVFGDRKTLADALAEDIAPNVSSGAAVSFAIRGYVTLVKKERGLWYPADPQTKKKVTEVGDGIWRSASGEKDLNEAEVDFRYLTNMKFSDFSGAQWAASFEEASLVAFGRPAKEMRQLLSADPDLFDDVVDDIYFRPVVAKFIVKESIFQGEARIRYTVSRLEKVDFVAEGRALLSEIARLRT